MRRKLAIWVCAATLVGILCCPTANAIVTSTSEGAGGPDCVYVAGNPDWYPIEYYDPSTERYEGVLPELLEMVGERTGLNFTYIRAGKSDQRLRLAKNGQVELLSGCSGDEEALEAYRAASCTVLTFSLDGRETEVRFIFTEIAPESLVSAVDGALKEISDREISGLTVRQAMEHGARARSNKGLLLLLAGTLAALLAAVIVLLVLRHRYKTATNRDELFDPMTGIGNKAYFVQRFEGQLSDQYRSIYGVVFVGFDIGRVNKYYGEDAAEDQLHFAANELMKSTADNEIVARVSGGGFAVARPCGGAPEVERWTQELLIRLNRYSEKYGKDYRPEFHAGIYMLSQSDRDSETVLFNARQGYEQAISGNMAFAFSHTELLNRESEKLQLKKQTLEAIQNHEFKMFLQFIVSAKDGRIVSAEALSRWEHPEKGLLYPGRYIELMESEKTIAELDFYIFEEACRQLELWQKEGRSLYISCNFTRITIDHENFILHLQEIAGRYFFNHSALVIEITEDAMESDKKTAFENISRCKALGFRIALDDAGNGYTSFSDLRDYPIDIVKIDRSILDSAVNQRGVALLKGMIALVHSLQMEVLCEGVETSQQAELLRQLGCDYMQGYYFCRALPREEANRFLRKSEENIEA